MAREELEIIINAKDRASKVFGNLAKTIGGPLKIATGAAVVGVGALTAAFAKSVQLANAQIAAETQLATVLESTGHAAGLSAQQMKDHASALQSVTTFGDEAIIEMQALLATFTNIGGAQFQGATEAILDVSVAMGQDLKTSAIQVGKALNDPIAGLGALRRVGIQFTDSQEAMIKSMVELGDTAGAQQMILDELGRQFGGQAQAQANTFAGQMQQVSNTIGDLGETIGFALLPVLTDMVTRFQEFLPAVEPIVQQFAEDLAVTIPQALTTISGAMADLGVAFGGATEDMDESQQALAGLAASLSAIVGAIGLVASGVAKVAEAVKILVGLIDQVREIVGLLQQVSVLQGAQAIQTGVSSALPNPFQIGADFVGDLFGNENGGGQQPMTINMDGERVGEIVGGHQGTSSRQGATFAPALQ